MPDLGSDLALAEPCLAARELSVSGWSLAEAAFFVLGEVYFGVGYLAR